MKIATIAAIGEGNRVLGKDNKLVWNIPEDTRFFRDTTRGHVVIMGRKTYESLGKPLPQRTNIVITRDTNFHPDGVVVCYSIKEAIKRGEDMQQKRDSDEELYIIGGGQIFQEALPLVDRLYLTIVEGHFEGDAFFPEYSQFTKVVSTRKSEGNGYHYTFLTLEK